MLLFQVNVGTDVPSRPSRSTLPLPLNKLCFEDSRLFVFDKGHKFAEEVYNLARKVCLGEMYKQMDKRDFNMVRALSIEKKQNRELS